ncbi:hypothetical protein [Alkaliphilus serpentinus]|uniref:Mannosyl-glycoprotein endo-beta-N-acetylglucosaminidase n=1 Tax=Alkaliphilus serpentinus TaxID=1482731 RepID=A0A833HPN5_9FIRM|nr:hypothetical protein [Alkaliphilus serpentinus]KAB3531101.1 hypothetical protein F8153_05555 [Alkaliphilus serpentinus]
MEDFSTELKGIKILNKRDINSLNLFIKEKYPHYNPGKRAKVLANTIHKLINESLSTYPEKCRSQIVKKILQGGFLSRPEGISMYDIFEASLNLIESDPQLIDSFYTWTNSHLNKPINIDTFKNYTMHKNEDLTIGKEEEFAEKIVDLGEEISSIDDKDLGRDMKKLMAINKVSVGCILLILMSVFTVFLHKSKVNKALAEDFASSIHVEMMTSSIHPHLPHYFHYRSINVDGLIGYLNQRNSILADEPYFSSVMNVAKEFHLNPLVLFAIAGHEQGFVPRNHPQALKIANNPYNVYNSWQTYNTDIIDSTRIAARTVINSSVDRPEGKDPFQWINRRYAEDQNWWRGVSSIFKRLEKEASKFPLGNF